MKTIELGNTHLPASRLAYGCWRIGGTWDPAEITPESRAAGHQAVIAAYEAGYTVFDNADIYCRGEAERIFGEALREVPGMRKNILVATKCGIRFPGEPQASSPQRYDFSADHIVRSCEGSLERMGIETIDLLMLHRPDYLADPEEVAAAFTRLKEQGKVRFFGVSNFRPMLVTTLQTVCPMMLVAHQVEISLVKRDALEDGTLDQCLVERLTPMAWSPLAAGLIGAGASRLLPSQQGYQTAAINAALDVIARDRGCSRTAVALAWLLKHPAKIMPVIGTIQPGRIREAATADDLELTREEWYRLLLAARGTPLP
jgi:predicted oxidoreductase